MKIINIITLYRRYFAIFITIIIALTLGVKMFIASSGGGDVSEVYGCYRRADRIIKILDGLAAYGGNQYAINKVRFFKDTMEFDSQFNISYLNDRAGLIFSKSPDPVGWTNFFKRHNGELYISFFSIDRKREYRFFKAPCAESPA